MIRRTLGKLLPIIKAKLFSIGMGEVGKGTMVHGKPFAVTKDRIYIGERCTINHGVMLSGAGNIFIGNDVRLSNHCQLQTGGLDLNHEYKGRPHIYKSIKIEDGVWVGAGAIITGGVTIGEGSVIAANAVVTKDVDPFTLVGGIPAKKIRSLK